MPNFSDIAEDIYHSAAIIVDTVGDLPETDIVNNVVKQARHIQDDAAKIIEQSNNGDDTTMPAQLTIQFTPQITFDGTNLTVSGTGNVPPGDDQISFIEAVMISREKILDWCYSMMTGHAFPVPSSHEDNRNSPQMHELNIRSARSITAEEQTQGDQTIAPLAYWYPNRVDFREFKVSPSDAEGLVCGYGKSMTESTLLLEAGPSRVLSITRQPMILQYAKWQNFSTDVESEESITFTHEHTDTMEVSTSETHSVGKSISVDTEISLPFGSADGTETVTVDDSVENSTAKGSSDAKVSTGEIRAKLQPGDKVVAAMTAYIGTVEAEVDVIGVLSGSGCYSFGDVHSMKWGRWPIYNPPHYMGSGSSPLQHNNDLILDWADFAHAAGGVLRSPATTVRIKSTFLAEFDGDVYDVDNFDVPTIQKSIYPHNPTLDVETIYESKSAFNGWPP